MVYVTTPQISKSISSVILISGASGISLSALLGTLSGDDGGDDSSVATCAADIDVCLTLDGGDLIYSSSSDIYGFQFNHDGCASGANGGDAGAAGFMVSASGSTALGFSLTGSFIPAGSGTLVSGVDCDTISGILISGASGSSLSAVLEETLLKDLFLHIKTEYFIIRIFNTYVINSSKHMKHTSVSIYSSLDFIKLIKC